MATLSKLVPGQMLHDYHKVKQGNTTLTREGHWRVIVVEVDLEKNRALCSWNSNTAEWFSERTIKKWRISEKEKK